MLRTEFHHLKYSYRAIIVETSLRRYFVPRIVIGQGHPAGLPLLSGVNQGRTIWSNALAEALNFECCLDNLMVHSPWPSGSAVGRT